jgi:L-lactate oxidase
MDGVRGAISMLGPAVDAVEGRVPVILDSGIRRGIDVYRAIAMGATAAAIGRPVLWGLTCGGALGVKSVYAHIQAELKSAMLLAGVSKVTALKREHLALNTGRVR